MRTRWAIKAAIFGITLAGLILTSASNLATPAAGFASDGTNSVTPDNLLPGDIVVLGTDDTFFDYLIPGKYTHTELYVGTVQPGEMIWDRDAHEWMPSGTHYLIHSTKSDNAGNGLGYSTWEHGVMEHADNVLVLRVLKPDGSTLTASERQQVVGWAKSKLAGGPDGYPVGPSYDINWLTKDANDPHFYCSELVWATYLNVLGLDLDAETSPLDVGVSPDDVWHSQYTSVIAGEVGSTTFQAPATIVKLTVFVDEVYYDDDYDPWPKGAGEEYIISRSGIGTSDDDGNLLAVEQGAPGNGKIGQVPDGYVSRSGSGAIDWNKYFYALVGWDQPMRIRVEAWEDDSDSGDDQYPTWQWWWQPSTWHGYAYNGWYWSGSRVDLGDCRYTVWFRIDAAY
ncbi:MAG: hypothetical protein Kow0069_11130 [Promethearchaeota archaeon]